MRNPTYFSFILLAIAFQSLGGIFGKYAALSLQVPTFAGILTNVFYILGLVCLLLQAIVWQQALIYYPLSIAYPCMSLISFVILFAAAFLFDEHITLPNILGLILVTAGIFVLFRYDGETV